MGGLLFALIIFSCELVAEDVSLSLHSSGPRNVSVGDTILVNVQIEPRSSSLTSASVYLRYDRELLEVISEVTDSEHENRPFRMGDFWEANIYQNSVDEERGELAYVAVTGRDKTGSRIVSLNRGSLAQVHFKVIKVPELSRTAKVEIQTVGRRQSSYTLLNQPGIRHLFDFDRIGLEVMVSSIHFAPTLDDTIESGKSRASDVAMFSSGRLSFTEDHELKVYNWRDLIDAQEFIDLNYLGMTSGLNVKVVGDSLYLKSNSNYFGRETLEFNVCDVYDKCESVRWEVDIVEVNDPPRFLNLSPLSLEQGESLIRRIDDVVFDVDNITKDLEFSCESGEYVLTNCGFGEIELRGITPGAEFVILSATDPGGATTVFQWEVTVNPKESVSPLVKNSYEGYKSLGDVLRIDLAEYVSDDDSSFDSILFDIESSGLIWEWYEDSSSIVELKFNAEGEVALSLRAEDLEGNVGEGLLSWFVERKYDSTDNQRIVLPDSSIYQENNDSKIWGLYIPFLSELFIGHSMVIPLESFTFGIDPKDLQWAIGEQENITAKVDHEFIEISASPTGKDLGWFELFALDEEGLSKKIRLEIVLVSEPYELNDATNESAGQTESLFIGDIPDVHLIYGESLFIPLKQPADSLVEWTYTGGVGLNIAFVDGGALITSSDPNKSRSILLFTASDSLGNEITDVVRVYLSNTEEMEILDKSENEEYVERSVIEKTNKIVVERSGEIAVNVGELKVSDLLNRLIIDQDPRDINWTIHGGANVEVAIERNTGIVVNAENAFVGREFFVLKGESGKNIYVISLTINISESLTRLNANAEYLYTENNGFELSSMLIGKVEVEEWFVKSSETQTLVENGYLYVAGPPGIYRIEVEARLIDGKWIKGGLVKVEVGIAKDKNLQTDTKTSFSAPIIHMPSELRIVEGGSEVWEVNIEDNDSSMDQVILSLQGDHGGFFLQGRKLFYDGSSAPDTLYLSVEDESGLRDEAAVKIHLHIPEVFPLSVSVTGYLLHDNTVKWDFISNKQLIEVELFVNKKKIRVPELDKHSIIWNTRGVTRADIDFVFHDFEGGIVELNRIVSVGPIGIGRGLYSPDRILKIEGEWRDSFALVYQDSLGYRISLREGGAKVFMHVNGNFPSLSYSNSEFWQDLPTEYGLSQIRASISGSGWIREDYSRVPAIVGSFLKVYPNPFNSSVALKMELDKSGFVEITVYDVLGRQIRSLGKIWREIGPSTIQWDGKDNDGRNVSSGVYIFRAESTYLSASLPAMLLR